MMGLLDGRLRAVAGRGRVSAPAAVITGEPGVGDDEVVAPVARSSARFEAALLRSLASCRSRSRSCRSGACTV